MPESDVLVHELFSAIEARDYDAVKARIAADCDFRAPGVALRGPDAFLSWERPFLDAFPDLHHHLGPVIASGDGIAYELVVHGTHTEPLATPEGQLPATGRTLQLEACNVLRLDGQGAIAAYHVYFDQVAFMVALGLVPAEGA
jgi:predicted ester cyclase